MDQLYGGSGNDILVFDKDDIDSTDGVSVHFSGGEGFDMLQVGSAGDGQIIDMTATAYQELEAVVIDATDAELKVGLDKILHNTTADEASSGQFVCTGAGKLDLEGYGWEMATEAPEMSADLRAAYEASNIDTTSLQGYTFSNNEGKEVTIWSDNESDEISFNGSEL